MKSKSQRKSSSSEAAKLKALMEEKWNTPGVATGGHLAHWDYDYFEGLVATKGRYVYAKGEIAKGVFRRLRRRLT